MRPPLTPTMPAEALTAWPKRCAKSAEGVFQAAAPKALPRAISGERKLQPSIRLI